MKEVVPVPVGIGEMLGDTPPPGPAVVEIGADDRVRVVGGDEPVVAAEAAVHVIREVVDVVDRREQTGVDRRPPHPVAQSAGPAIHLLARKRRFRLLAVGQHKQAGTIGLVPTAGIGVVEHGELSGQ